MINYTPIAAAAPLLQINMKFDFSLIDRWIAYIDGAQRTRETYTRNIQRFADWLKQNGITQPDRATIIQYRDELEQNHKPTTVHSYLVAVKLFFSWTELENLYPNVAARVKNIAVDMEYKKDPLTSRQAHRVLNNLDTDSLTGMRDYAIIALMLTTGLRTRSIMTANIEDIKPLGEIDVLYYQGKGRKGKNEYVKLSAPVHAAINRYLNARQGEGEPLNPLEPLFVSTSNRCNGERITTRSISRIVKNALIAAGCNSDRLTAHSLRHTAATLAMLNGASLTEVQQLLGHKNINITMVYLHTLEKSKNSSTDRITGAIFGDDLTAIEGGEGLLY